MLGDYQYTFVRQDNFNRNDELKSNFLEISISPMMTTPFETFYFKDYRLIAHSITH